MSNRPLKGRNGLSSRLLAVAFSLVVVLATTRRTSAAVEPEKVDDAVKRGVAWLYSQQKPTGQWENDLKRNGTGHDWVEMQGVSYGGYTALCVFALLEAGEKPGDPRLEKAVAFLRTCDMFSTYAVGLRAMAFSKLPQNAENRAVLQKDAERLLGGIIKQGGARGLWDYESGIPGQPRPESGTIDLSISQFGVLGLWAAVQAGANVPIDTWKLFDEAWRKQQLPDGAWSYDGEERNIRATMTAAGVATLLIVQDVLGTPAQIAAKDGVDLNISRGIGKLSRSFPETAQMGAYAWYGVERVGTAGGLQRIGPYDWYEIGARRLLQTQSEDGGWPDGGAPGMTRLPETAMSILFLVHGRAPTVIGKLDYSGLAEGSIRVADWNRRPRDAANLVKFLSHVTEQPLNWRAISSRSSTEAMLESPVMYASGSKIFTLTQTERDRLKGYLDRGGLLLAAAEAASRDGKVANDDFSLSIIDLGAKLYPQYKFRELPPTHPIYKDQQFRGQGWRDRPVAWGLSNGVRELIVLLPVGDFGRAWHSTQPSLEKMKFEVGANVIQYAVARNPGRQKMADPYRPRYDWDPFAFPPRFDVDQIPVPAPAEPSPEVDPSDPAATTRPAAAPPPLGAVPPDARFIVVGRLKVGQNWDPEPAAWQRMSVTLANQAKVFLTAVPVELKKESLAPVKVLHWTGTTAVKLSASEQAILADFVKGGGTLVVDAAGGSTEFADSAQAALIDALGSLAKPRAPAPGAPATTQPTFGILLPNDDALYEVSGHRITTFSYRTFMRSKLVGRLDAPRLRCLAVDGRRAVYFSREDLTAGICGVNTDGIFGYSPTTAGQIMKNILLLAQPQPRKPE
jgi:hypothetical protein